MDWTTLWASRAGAVEEDRLRRNQPPAAAV